MTVDHRIECESEEAQEARSLAWAIVAIFPVGVPLALFALLFSHRDEIIDRKSRSGDTELGYIGELRS